MSEEKRHESAPPEPELRKVDDWVLMKQAHERIGCARSTVYKWVKAGKVRKYRPGKELWLYLPDLLAAEAEATRGVSG